MARCTSPVSSTQVITRSNPNCRTPSPVSFIPSTDQVLAKANEVSPTIDLHILR